LRCKISMARSPRCREINEPSDKKGGPNWLTIRNSELMQVLV
jgi:hypothetical protein